MTASLKLLILGGTTEASDLARRLADAPGVSPILSLAGRTASPRQPPLPLRIGGFGGPEGLARWLREQSMEAVVDATHPFAAQISANAVAATTAVGIPLVTILRPPWQPVPGDQWTPVGDMDEAVAALPAAPRRVWLTIGGNELAVFRDAPQHDYLVRAVDRPPDSALPPRHQLVLARGPFGLDDERALLREQRVEILVTKNSGGTATAEKLTAAREAGLPVIMVDRPTKPAGHVVETAEQAVAWIATVQR